MKNKKNTQQLTQKQLEILEYIKLEKERIGYPPSVREICNAVGLKSTSSVHSHLEILEKKGFIHRNPTKPRAIEVMDESLNLVKTEMVNIPIIKNITEMMHMENLYNMENLRNGNMEKSRNLDKQSEQSSFTCLPIPSDFLAHTPPNDVFLFCMNDDSMKKIHLLKGNYVLVKRTKNISNGEKVVTSIDGEMTVRTFYQEQDSYRLQPENDELESFIIKNIQVFGKVVRIFQFSVF